MYIFSLFNLFQKHLTKYEKNISIFLYTCIFYKKSLSKLKVKYRTIIAKYIPHAWPNTSSGLIDVFVKENQGPGFRSYFNDRTS